MKLDTSHILADVSEALKEDLGSGDVTAALLPDELMADAEISSREPMVLCGQAWVNAVFASLNPSINIQWLIQEGAWIDKPDLLCRVQGKAKDILTGERTALNFLQTLSGTATKTRHYVQQLKQSQTKLLDTRKTLPKLRYAQKYAVFCGGGYNHRLGLFDAFLIKENHIKACGSISAAISKAKAVNKGLLIEVEVETLEEFQEALRANPDRILLDNFSYGMLKQALAFNQPKRCELEASGGISLSMLSQVGELGLDYISVGALTKSVEAIDLTLLIRTIQ